LVQTTGRRLAVLRSRIVILDTDGVRGPWTASWLAQSGAGEVWLYRPAAATPLVVGPLTSEIVLDPEAGERALVSPAEAAELFAKGARIYDVEDSVSFHRRRISGAVFAAPDLLAGIARGDPHAGPAILTSSDGVLAGVLAARLVKESLPALSVAGGTSAWIEAGLPVEVGQPGVDLTHGRDARYGGWESYLGVVEESAAARDERFRKYLAWERDLVNRIDAPGAMARFSLIAP
jgi:rhodanese-related sulfurtransferase